MINITPIEEFYLHEIARGKSIKQIGQEQNIKAPSVTMSINRLKKRTNLSKFELIQKFFKKDYQVMFQGNKVKGYYDIMSNPKQIINLKKLGYNIREIIKQNVEKV